MQKGGGEGGEGGGVSGEYNAVQLGKACLSHNVAK